MPLIARLIIDILITVLSLTVYLMLRYMRKHPPRSDDNTQNVSDTRGM